ncbi:Dvir\GJ24577-PA-like protein [Anopheles sinensis]|uniref:Dvir\GJ24577-PA-like protein n=1 Tax=Anopheles sinensis TaxID=74873 RepID=A0A084WQQ0_ANOSI|nr:Dvir\GJ24577-PA-like protein [Anopheles sinensis]
MQIFVTLFAYGGDTLMLLGLAFDSLDDTVFINGNNGRSETINFIRFHFPPARSGKPGDPGCQRAGGGVLTGHDLSDSIVADSTGCVTLHGEQIIVAMVECAWVVLALTVRNVEQHASVPYRHGLTIRSRYR